MNNCWTLAMVVALTTSAAAETTTESRFETQPPPLEDHAMAYWPKEYQVPPSAWIEKEKAAYAGLLENGEFEVLVLPFQVVDEGLGRSVRSLMGAKLAMAIAESGADVADPYLLGRALGDGWRQFDQARVSALAQALSARRVIQGYVGHDQMGTLRLVIRDAAVPERGWQSDQLPVVNELMLDDVSITLADPAIEAFDARLEHIMAFLGYSWNGPVRSAAHPGPSFPPDPRNHDELHPLVAAYHLQLLGALVPERARRVRERLFERSLLAIDRLDRRQRERVALKARAYRYLGMRPAALDLLRSPEGHTELAVRAVLDGDLPTLEKLLGSITRPQDRLLALIDKHAIRSTYQLYDADEALAEAATLDVPQAWQALVERRLIDWDYWLAPSNRGVKEALDEAFPVTGYDLDTLMHTAVTLVMESFDPVNPELYPGRHIDRLMERTPELWCCHAFDYRPRTRDYLDLLEGTARANLIHQFVKRNVMQGLPKQALELLDGFDRHYYEHPDFVLERSHAQNHLAADASQDAARTLQLAAFKNAANVFYWEQGQSPVSDSAYRVMWNGNAVAQGRYGNFDNVYAGELPYVPGYFLGGVLHAEPGNLHRPLMAQQQIERELEFTLWDFSTIRTLLDANLDESQRRQVREVLSTRFRGVPERFEWLASESRKAGEDDAVEGHLRDGITVQPRHWPFYEQLGELLVRDRRIDEAVALYESYPPFHDETPKQRIGLTSAAFRAGASLYWAGELDRARYFYELSAGLETGAEGGLISGFRLAMMDGDYPRALAGAVRTGNRYGPPHAYRDYLTMLFMLGHSDEAWSAFDALAARFGQSKVWEAPLTGFRRDRFSDDDIVAWVGRKRFSDPAVQADFARQQLLRAAIMDRIPSDALLAAIEDVVGPFWLHKEQQDLLPGTAFVMRNRNTDPRWVEIVPIESPEVYVARSLRSLREGNYDGAWALLSESNGYFRILLSADHAYTLPYYTIAGLKAGAGDEVRDMLEHLWNSGAKASFDYWLARAAERALAGDEAASLKALDFAWGRLPATDTRALFPAYEYAEVCEWLWRETARPVYRQRVLELARMREKQRPWTGWVHALIATYSNDAGEGHDALEKALYLDDTSLHLTGVPAARLKEAQPGAETSPFYDPDHRPMPAAL